LFSYIFYECPPPGDQKYFKRYLEFLFIFFFFFIFFTRNSVTEFGLNNVKFNTSSVADDLGKEYIAEASQVLMSSLKNLCKPQCVPNTNDLIIFINTTTPFTNLKWSTNESYSLNISTNRKRVYYIKKKKKINWVSITTYVM